MTGKLKDKAYPVKFKSLTINTGSQSPTGPLPDSNQPKTMRMQLTARIGL